MHRRTPRLLAAALACALVGSSGAHAAETVHVIDFDDQVHGDFLDTVYSADGLGPIYVDGFNPNNPYVNSAVAFDSSTPTPSDLDLGTPNSLYGGPGVGSGGASNDLSLGRLLIVSGSLVDADNDGRVDAPDDLVAQGTRLEIDFSNLPAPCYGEARVRSMRVVDIESYEASSTVTFLDRFGGTLLTQSLPVAGDNGVGLMEFGTNGIAGVERIVVVINGSGAIDDIEFSCPGDDEPPAEPFVCEGGIKCIGLRYLGNVNNVTVTVTGKKDDEPIASFSNINFGDTFQFESNDPKKGKFPSTIVIHVFDGTTEIETTPIHVSCSQPIDIGFVFGSFEIDKLVARGKNPKGKGDDDGSSRDDDSSSDDDDSSDDDSSDDDSSSDGKSRDGKSGSDASDGAPCEGGLTDITLAYEGNLSNATVTITDQKGDNEFARFQNVANGDELAASYDPKVKKDKFPSTISVNVFDGNTLVGSTTIHVSCSQPIAPGFIYGDFSVVEFTSRKGGRITDADGDWSQDDDDSSSDDDDDDSSSDDDAAAGAPCEGGLTQITVEYIGSVWNARVELTDKKGENVLATFDVVNNGDALHAQYDPDVKKDKFPSEIVFNVYDGDTRVESTHIHVSCSQPIAPGFVYGGFVVTSFASRGGGLVESTAIDFPTMRVNSGGNTYVDAAGNVWAADTAFSGGGTYQRPGLGIDGTTSDPLFDSERYGNFGYDFSVPEGLYEVKLHMAEIYWQTPGARSFDVLAEGDARVAAIDLVSEAGYATAHVVTLLVEVRDGSLNLQFVTVNDNAKVSAISIDRLGSLGPGKGATKRKKRRNKARPRHRKGRSRR